MTKSIVATLVVFASAITIALSSRVSLQVDLLASRATSDTTLQQSGSANSDEMPIFEFDPTWPRQPFPNEWVLGNVVGVRADAQDHIWIVHRPHTILPRFEDGAIVDPPRAICCKPAPPVIEFDQQGAIVQSWGGPAPGYNWPEHPEPYGRIPGSYVGEHGIYVDHKGNVWMANNGSSNDTYILKFTGQGKFLLQIGKLGKSNGSNDTTVLGKPTGMVVDPAANEVFISDGYANRRVIVFDADTGAYKRHWGAYGKKPDDSVSRKYSPNEPLSSQFNAPHGINMSKDGLIYVADRGNCRIQVFQKDGTFVRETRVAPEALNGSAFDIGFSGDPGQRFVYMPDGRNARVWILRRSDMKVLGNFGYGGHFAGGFTTPHNLATDSKGNIYVADTAEGKRVQRFLFKGLRSAAK